MRTKEIVADILQELPDEVSLEEVVRQIGFCRCRPHGFEAYEREGGVSVPTASYTG